MSIKWIGAVLVIACCGWFGFSCAANYRKEEKCLKQLIAALDCISCELQYRLTQLPELCRKAAANGRGVISAVFFALARELEDQLSPNVSVCMSAAVQKAGDIPVSVKDKLNLLGHSLGIFDLHGQLTQLEALRQECENSLKELSQNRDARLRGYQTLGLCAGAALVILFV